MEEKALEVEQPQEETKRVEDEPVKKGEDEVLGLFSAMIEEVNQRGAECIEKCKNENELPVYKEWCASMIISMSRSI